jgi:decaprenylphospho-beta-D-ribofuranose 2-oxidase
MGLTGIVLDAQIRLVPIESSRVVVRYRPFQSLEEARDLFLAEDREHPFTVAWLSPRLERGVATLGRFARREEVGRRAPLPVHGPPRLRVPWRMPGFLLNRVSMAVFYRLFYALQAGRGTRLEEYDKFFYPLDGIDDWNRLYGRRGFTQYQFVVPPETGLDTIRQVGACLRRRGTYPCLAVLKVFGDRRPGLLSFPRAGFTLAMDIPLRDRVFPALEEADRIVLAGGGRLYLAKDSRAKPATVRAMYPELSEWLQVKRSIDPDGRFASDLSRRLGIG